MIGSYTAFQVELSNYVIKLRDSENKTFKDIAKQLVSEGYKSPRGFQLKPNTVFSIYKKRLIRDARLGAEPKLEIHNFKLLDI
jgi:hypothetical protein